MKITKQELEKLEIPANYVLVKPLFNGDTLKSNDVDWFISPEFTPGRWAETTCEVVKVCSYLTPVRDENGTTSEGGVQWIVPIEIQPNDVALVYFFTIVNALLGTYERHKTYTNGRRIDCDGEIYVFMKYDEIYCAKRGEQIITVNGFNIARRLPMKYSIDDSLALTGNMMGMSDNYAEIVYSASPVLHYVEEEFADEETSEGLEMLLPGQIVRCNPKMVIETEYEMKKGFFDEVYFRIQQKDIFTVVSEQLVEY